MVVPCSRILGGIDQRASCLTDPHPCEHAEDFSFRNLFSIELHAHYAGGIGIGFEHAPQGSQPRAYSSGLSLVGDPFNRPQHMAISLGDGRTGRLGNVADAAQGKDLAIVVNTQ